MVKLLLSLPTTSSDSRCLLGMFLSTEQHKHIEEDTRVFQKEIIVLQHESDCARSTTTLRYREELPEEKMERIEKEK